MKKFMIFLLMAFLYLGTCQARSESAHPNDGKLKLLSWVTPTPSQSFLTRSTEAVTFSMTPNGTVHLGVMGAEGTQDFQIVASQVLPSIHYEWKLKKADTTYAIGGDQSSCRIQDLNVGDYSLYCDVKYKETADGEEKTTTVGPVSLIVSEHLFTVNIVGAVEACEKDNVTLTAQINANQLVGFKYHWFVDGEAPVNYRTDLQTFTFCPDSLFGAEPENLTHEFTVVVSYAGCSSEYSAVHEFVIIPTPTVAITTDSVICPNAIPAYTATVDGPAPYRYEWFVNHNIDNVIATTTANTFAIQNDTIKSVGVRAVYQNAYCNSDTAFVNIPKVLATPGQLEKVAINRDKDTLCVGDAVTFTVTDTNTTFGDAIYTWSVNGIEVEGVTTTTYNASFEEVGMYIVSVNSTYANYPCEGDFSVSDTVTITSAPAIAVAGTNVICEGDTAMLIATPGFETYTWTGVGVPADFNNDTLRVGLAGTYTVSGVTKYGCVSEEAEEITVQQFGGNLQVTATEYQVCPGTTVALNANLQGWNNENITYKWSNGATGSLLEVTPDKDTTLTVTAYAGTATDTACKMAQVITVNVITEALPQITLTPNSNDTVCLDGQVKVKVSNDANYSGLYNWYYDGIEIPGQHMDSITVTMVESGDHFIAAKRANYVCGLDTLSAPFNVTVIELPELVVTGNNVICQDTIIMTATEITDAKYLWAGPITFAAADTLDTLRTVIPGIYSVKAVKGGCETNTVVFKVDQIGGNLQVYASAIEVCPGTRVMLNANVTGLEGQNIMYVWTKKGETTPSDTGSTVSVVPEPATGADSVVYNVTAFAVSNDPNAEPVCEFSSSIAIYVIGAADMTVEVAETKICQGGQVTAVAKGGAANSYTWYLNGQELMGQNDSVLTYNLNNPGQYVFGAKPAENCSEMAITMSTDTVTVYAVPVLTVDGNNYICNGDTARVAATAYGTETYKYAWFGPTASTDSLLKTVNDGVYTVKATGDSSGCYAMADVTIYQFGADLQLLADQYAICPDEQVVLNANLEGFNNENVTYTWTKTPATVALPTTSTIVDTPHVTTKYFVTAHAGNCSMTDSTVITVNPRTTYTTVIYNSQQKFDDYGYPGSSVKFSSDDHRSWFVAHYCEGQEIATYEVSDSRSTGDANTLYTWFIDGVAVPGLSRNLIIPSGIGVGSHYIQAMANVEGCDVAELSKSLNFVVHPTPNVEIIGNNVICNGDTAILTANASTMAYQPMANVKYAYGYQWSNGAKTATDTITESGIYTVTVVDSVSKRPVCSVTKSIDVTILGGDIQLHADKVNICDGEFITLNADLDGFNNENVTYTWTATPAVATLPVASTIVDTPHVNTKYVVTANAGNCTMIDSIDVNVTKVIDVTAKVAKLDATVDTVCEGYQLTLIATATPANAASQFVWFLNGVAIPGENLDTITVPMNEAGTYTFAAMAVVDGCNIATVSAPDTIVVAPTPVVTILGEHFYTANAENPAILTAAVVPAGEYTYQWNAGNASQDGATDTVTAYGVYQVTATSANGCMAVSEPFTVSAVENLQVHIVGVNAACQNDVVVLSAVVDNDLEGHTYQWFVNGQIINGQTGSHYMFLADTLYEKTGLLANDFHVEISRTGCATVTSPVHQLLITPVPLAVVSAPEKVCKGNGATLEAVVYQIADNAQYQYVWFKDGEAVDTIDYINTYDVATGDIEGHKYAVQVLYQDLACSSDTSAEVEVKFYKEPGAITLSLDPSTICTTNQAHLGIYDTNTSVEDFGVVTYTWYVNGIEMPLVHGDTLIADFDHNGEYTFWAVASYEKYPCAVIYTDTVVENVVMHPTVAITGDPILCNSDTINLYAVINDTVGTMDYTYEWRLYNYSLEDIENNDFAIGSPSANLFVNNANTTFNVSGASDPWLSVFDVNAQDYPYVYTVVVTTPEGCRVESEPYLVYVADTIKVVATVDYDTVCSTGQITAVAHLGNYNVDNLTAQWYKSIDNGANWEPIPYAMEGVLRHVPGVTTQYKIVVTQTTTGCVAESEPITVTVIRPKSIDQIVVFNDGNLADQVCEGAQLEITAYFADTIQGSQGQDSIVYYIDDNLTYMWELNGMQLQTVHGPQFSSQAYIYDNDSVNYTYKAYVTYNVPGCELVHVASNTVHVRRNPIVTIDGNPNVCYRGRSEANVILLAWVDGTVDTNATYTWFESGHREANFFAEEINQYQASKVVTHDNPYIFTVEVTNGDGCTTISDPFYVNVYAAPVVNITGSQDSVCTGGDVELHANLNNYHDPLLIFQWYKDEVSNGGLIPGATHEVETFATNESTDYIVEVTHMMNAFSSQEYCVAYDTFHVDVELVPEVHAINDLAGVHSICEGRNITFAVDTVRYGVKGGDVFTWYVNGQTIENVNEPVFVHSPVAVNGVPTQYVYQVSLKQAASACQSEIFSLTDTITVYPQPALYIQTDPIVCTASDSNIKLVVNMDPTTIDTSANFTIRYNWFEDNAVISPLDTTGVLYLTRPYRDYPYNFSVQTVNEYGCISEASTLVYVNDTISVLTNMSDTAICLGGEVVLNANLGDWNADQLRYQWSDNGVAIPAATTREFTFTPATVGEHIFTLNVEQMTSHCVANSRNYTVNVRTVPSVDTIFNNIPDNKLVCDGYQVELNAHVINGVAGGEVYTWYRNGEVIEGATEANYSEVVSALNGEPTDYVYEVSVAQTASGCESDVKSLASFTVNPNPVVEIATDPIVCVDTVDNVVLVANVYPAVAGLTFKWFEDNVPFTGVGQNKDTLKLSKPYSENPYNFRVELVNQYNCTASSEASVYVNAKPVVHVFASENNICQDGVITLNANLADWNADQLVYQWQDNGDDIYGATTLNYEIAPNVTGEHNYTLIVEQLTSGCVATSDTAKVNVNVLPVIDTVTISDYTVCYGAQLTITAHVSNVPSNSIPVYTWYRNGILMEGANAATIYDAPGIVDNNTQYYQYTAVVTYPEAGCTSLPASSDNVVVYANPRVQITGDQHVCETDSVFLIASVDTNGIEVGQLHYTWYESGQIRDNMGYGIGDRQFFAEYLHARTEPYIFSVDVWRDTTTTGCISHSQDFYVYVYTQPVVNITATDTTICTNGEVTLTANLNDYNADNITYQWYEVKTRNEVRTIGFDRNTGVHIDSTFEVAYNEIIPGATSRTYTANYDHTATMGVLVLQTNTVCTAVDEINIHVAPIPVVTEVKVSDSVVCDGALVTVSATINPADAEGAVYTWFRNGQLIEGVYGASFSEHVYTTPDHVTDYTYSAIVTLPSSGCSSNMSINNAIVTVKNAPAEVYITGNNVICYNDSTVLTAHSDVTGGTFTWNDGTTGDTKVVKAGIYTVTYTLNEGCTMTSAPFTVESFGTDLYVSASETNICQGEHTTLYVDQNGWNGNVTYLWSNGSTATTVDVNPDTTTTYTVTATVINEAGTCYAEGEVTINVNPRPETPIVVVIPDTACVGTQVTALIPRFKSNYHVIWYMDGVQIPGQDNNGYIIFDAEAGTHTVAARVVSDEGCISDLSLPYAMLDGTMTTAYYVGIAAPTSVEISGFTTICEGGETTLYANVVPNEPATYRWFKNGQALLNSNTPALTVASEGSYFVEAGFHGCVTVSEPVVVTVQLAPQLELTATDTTICEGGFTVITAEATGYNNADFVYNWSNGYQGSVYTLEDATVGDHKFIVTASQVSSGCVAVDSITIHVNADPVAPVLNVNNALTATICDGGQVTLTVANAALLEGASYTWYRNSSLIDGATLSTLTESPVTVDGDETPYVYTVIATLPVPGCGSSMSNTATVNVISTPVATVSVEGNTTICEGGSTILHANVSPVADYTYQWYKDNVRIANATSADYTVAENARETAYNFTVEVSLHAGCTTTAAADPITVVADPVVTTTISNAISCVGGNATITADADGGVDDINGLHRYTYEWYRNDLLGVIGNTREITVNAEEVGTYTYVVKVSSEYGCQNTSLPISFSVVADPVVTITRVPEYDATVCNGGSTALRANVEGGYGETSYQWYMNGNLIVGATNHVLAIDNLQAGNNDVYTVVVAQSGVGCEGYASAAINDLVTVSPAYTVSITGFGNVCEGGTLTLNADVDGVIDGDFLTYQWYKVMNGHATPIEGATSENYQTSELLLGDSYEYFVMVNSIFSGCNIVSNTVPANVVAAPTVSISGANTVCEGGSLTLNAFVNGGVDGENYIYTWNWTGAASGSATTNIPNFVPTISANDAAAPYYFTVTISRADETGCTATSEAHEVNVLAVPTVVVTADNAMVCENGQVTFTAHVSPVGSYNYVWTVNDQQQPVNASTVTYNATSAGTIPASVIVSTANASASCTATGTLAVPVQVVAVPVVTVTRDHEAMCVGGAVTLTVNDASFNNIPGNLVYQWYLNGESLDGAVARQIVQTINNPGAYRYSVKVSSTSNIGCVSDESVPVTVLVAEQPVVTLNSADGLAICEGGNITLTGVVSNYGNTINGAHNGTVYGNMTFDWTSNGTNVHHNTNVNNAMNQITDTLDAIGNYRYQVVVTPSGFNCQPQNSNFEVVNVVGNPSWTEVHVYSTNGADGCIGDMVMLNAEIVGGAFDFAGATGGHIQWTVNDGTNTTDVIGGLGGNSYDLPTAPGTYTYTPTFVGNIGSGCQLANNVAQRTITIHELPTAAFTSGDGTAICANDASASAELVITFTGVAPFTYQVMDGNNNIVAAATTQTSTVSIYVAPTEQTTYRIVMVQDAFCQNSALEADAMATVYVNNIEFSENFFESGCTDNGQVTIHFNMISGNHTAPFTVIYDNGMQVSGNISNNTATFAVPTAPGDYNAVITIDGCDYAIVVRVLAGDYGFGGSLPIMDQRWNDVVVVNNNPATNGGHTFVGFQWYRNGVAIPGATYSNYQEIGGLNGFYAVELIERDAAGNMITYKTCEMYFNSVSTVKVYPVPANVRQEVTIELDLTAEELEGAVLDIYSVTGALINHMTDLKPITKVEGFKAQGTYFGRILTGTNEIKTVKFVIVK